MENKREYDASHFDIIFNDQEMVKTGYEILDFNMNFMENTHTKVRLNLAVKKSHFNDWELFLSNRMNLDEGDLGVTLLLEKRKYFTGVLIGLKKGIHDDEGYKVEIELESKSVLMDRTKYISVYQNPKLSYFDIIRQITSYYNDKLTIMGVTGKEKNDTGHFQLDNKIEKGIIVQYSETDWEFIVRILSHLGLALNNIENGGIMIGFQKHTMEELEVNDKSSDYYEIMKKIASQTFKSRNLETSGFYVLGDKVFMKSNNGGYISSGEIVCRDNKFYGKYIIKDYNYTYPYIYNDNIKGVTLEGKVKRVPYATGNKLGVAADFMDGVNLKSKELSKENGLYKVSYRNDYIMVNGNIERRQFPYVTPYSKTKTGLFCTPEVGDNVLVYFGTNVESDAYVVGSVKNERSLRFSNPFERNYVTTEEEMELFGELDNDMGESNNTKDMLKSVEASVDKLINFSLRYDKYGLFTKGLISEESKIKSSLLHENISITAKEGYSLNSDNINVIANSTYKEKADSKREDIDKKTGVYNSKQEMANKMAITTNSHNIKVRG